VPSTNWTVEVDGVDRNVSVSLDPQSGKTLIRVDGRMAARPLAADEQERELMIGRAKYLLRRDGDGFDLDLVDDGAPVYIPPPPASRYKTREEPMPAKSGGFPIIRVLLGVLGTFVFLVAAGYTKRAWAYSHVPWQAYKEPAGEFLIDFPGDPDAESEDINVNGTIMTVTQLHKVYRGHLYSIEYAKMPFVVTDNREPQLADSFVDSYLKKHGGTILTRTSTYVAQHNGTVFTANLPKSDDGPECVVRGAVALRKGHLYSIIFARGMKDVISFDGDHFMNSFKLPDDMP